MKRQKSIRTKLFLCFGFLVFTAAAASAYSLATVAKLRSLVNDEISGSASRLDLSRRVTISLANMRSDYRGIDLFARSNPAQLEKSRKSFEASASEIQSAVREMKAGRFTDRDREMVGVIEDGVTNWLEQLPVYVRLNVEGRADEALQQALKYSTPIVDSMQTVATEFGEANLEREKKAVAEANASIGRNQAFLALLLLIVLVAAAAGFLIVARMSKALNQIEGSVAASAEQVGEAAAQLSSSSQTMAQGASEQAAALQQTSASTQEVNAMAHRNAENSRKAAAVAQQSGTRFAAANHVLEQMVAAMAEISGSSHKISKIVKVIDEIAFQTNILALNAAVEAARAGKAGMGFAVVADEVRNLAQRCAQAAKETTELIEESIEKSKGGSSKADEASAALQAIGAEAQMVKALIDEVHAGSNEQARGLEEIGKAVGQIEQVTQGSAASAEQSAAAAAELNGQSDKLKDVVDRLVALVSGTASR